jgi:hypothetical protein
MRKEISITITDEGRDKGKTFLIREMPALQAEKWAIRALLALGRANTDLADFDAGAGMAAFAGSAFRAMMSMQFEAAEPLLDEMMGCIMVKPDANNPNITRPLLEDDIEEVATLLSLRREVFQIHVGFSLPGKLSR